MVVIRGEKGGCEEELIKKMVMKVMQVGGKYTDD